MPCRYAHYHISNGVYDTVCLAPQTSKYRFDFDDTIEYIFPKCKCIDSSDYVKKWSACNYYKEVKQ